MSRYKAALLAATLIAAGVGGLAYAQPNQPIYDPAQLPETQGKVAQYSLTPRGEADGLILDDGTEVYFPPHLSSELVFAVRPGDTVTIHGLKARVLPVVLAMSITNDATHQTVIAQGLHGPAEPTQPMAEVTGQIKEALHSPRGEVNGVLLTDGTEVRLPPPDAQKLGDILAAGKQLVVRGSEVSGPLGKLVMAREIGPDASTLTKIAGPGPFGGPWERMMHGGHGFRPHGPGPHGGPGPDAGGPGAPPLPPPPVPTE
jgi:hypothetical protein